MAKAKKDGDLNKKKPQNKLNQNGNSKSQVKEKEKEKVEEVPKEEPIIQSQEILEPVDEKGSQTLTSGMVMNIKVIRAKNIKGLKGDRVNSFVRVQFSDFDYKDSPVVTNDCQPEYNFSTDLEFEANELIIDTFLNKTLSLTLIEQLPKEKTSILGTTEISLSDLVYKSLEYKNNVFNESGDADEKIVIMGCDNNNDNNINNTGATNPDAPHPTTDVPINGDNQIKKPNEGNDKSNTGEEGEPTSDDSLSNSNPNDIASYLTITKTAPIIYLNPRLLPSNTKGDDELTKGPEFTVEVTISNFLIDPEIIEHSNFINLHLGEVYPVPEEWSLKEGSEKDLNSNIYSYKLNICMPVDESNDRIISIPGGQLVSGSVTSNPNEVNPQILMFPKETCNSMLRPKSISNNSIPNASIVADGANGVTPNNGNNSNTNQSGEQNPGNNNASNSNANASFNTSNNNNSNNNNNNNTNNNNGSNNNAGGGGGNQPMPNKKIQWNKDYVIWLNPVALDKLRDHLTNEKHLEFEFVREFQPKYSHLVDTYANKYRGKVDFDASFLMYPRVKGINGHFQILNYENSSSNSNSMYNVSQEKSPDDPNTETNDVSEPVPLQQVNKNTSGSKIQTNSTQKDESSLYKNLKTQIYMGLTLKNPLLNKKKLQPINKKVSDFITPKVFPKGSLYSKKSKQATEDFQDNIQDVVRKLVKEYITMNNTENDAVKSNDNEITKWQWQKKKFLYHLNKSGSYFMLKEQLKAAVIDVVKESFQKTSPFISKAELQTFINEVYVFLIDNMHIAFNKIIKIGSNKDVLEVDPDKLKTKEFNSLKDFADSCEVDRKFNQAALYHQERIARWEDSYQAWFDYGCFCMRCDMTIRGEECFKEILSKNDKHIPSLIAYSAICCIEEKYEESQLYIECACRLQPKNVIAHTVAGLVFDYINEEEESEKYLKKAYEIFNNTQAYKKLNKSFFVLTAEFLIKCHAGQLAERALTEEILNNPNYVYPYILLNQLEIQRGNYSNALERIKEALEIQQDNSSAWSALGNLQFIQENYEDSQISYETVVSLPREPADIDLVFCRLGFIYLNNVKKLLKSFDYQSPENHSRQMATIKHLEKQAKAMYIHASEIKPTSQTWLGVGKACYLLKEYSEAEDALSEANVLNNRDGDVWAYIALLCLTLNRLFEANQAISQALRFGLKDHEILKQVGMEFMRKREPFPSIECFRIYLSSTPDDNEAKFYFSKCLEYEENPEWYNEDYEQEKLREAEEAARAKEKAAEELLQKEAQLENMSSKLSYQNSNSKSNINSDIHSNASEERTESMKSLENFSEGIKNSTSLISNDMNENFNKLSTSINGLEENANNTNNNYSVNENIEENVLNE